MCGIFGAIVPGGLNSGDLKSLIKTAQIRGKDSSGIIKYIDGEYAVSRADYAITKLVRDFPIQKSDVLLGHSRLVTNGTKDNQPVLRNGIAVIHNGVIVNDEQLWHTIGQEKTLEIDSEIIPAIMSDVLNSGGTVSQAANQVLDLCQGVVASVAVIPSQGIAVLFSNNGSLYLGEHSGGYVFSSEKFALEEIDAQNISQVRLPVELQVPKSQFDFKIKDFKTRFIDLVPELSLSSSEENLLEYVLPEIRRCSRCVLPETMPFILFGDDGVCNYCSNYKIRNQPRPKAELFQIVEQYRRSSGDEVIVPFSGGRDSCYGLHLIVKELELRPLTYTYDWGMVTDLGRRNISRMSSALGVENIIIAADIAKKRDNIRKNLQAWLRSPNLGMLSVLTAGDKHFFKYVEDVKRRTNINLNLWGINPLEVTHFKSGFLGVPPDFAEEKVYSHGAMKQLKYQKLRLQAMLESPKYFNSSLWDTLSGEYYRSFTKKSDYFHIFDYWRWDEQVIDSTLSSEYDWERAPDTSTTWRIGDGTAAFYNYVYYTVAGFTEHDTFRSNQIREGDITRSQALELIADENKPRYANLKWYLDVLGLEFESVIKTINAIPKLYNH